MLKTKGCVEVVQATKLRAIGASDQEQAGKFVKCFFSALLSRRSAGCLSPISWTPEPWKPRRPGIEDLRGAEGRTAVQGRCMAPPGSPRQERGAGQQDGRQDLRDAGSGGPPGQEHWKNRWLDGQRHGLC
ncbi:uncharacterized protein LOC144093671 [Amblyomma americanum]